MVWGSGGRAGRRGWPGWSRPCRRSGDREACGADPADQRAGDPHLVTSPTSWVVSASWPGVRQVARLRPRPSQMVWSLVVSPPVTAPAPPAGLPGSSRAPFPGPSGVLVGPDHRGVDLGVPVQLPSPLGLGAQGGLDPSPGPVGLPAREPFVDRLPGPVPLGQIPPRHPATHPKQAAVEDLTVVPPTPTPPRRHRWQQRRQPLPLFVGDLESPVHGQLLPHQLHPTKLTHRSKKHTLVLQL
jgi:hypothetical protein